MTTDTATKQELTTITESSVGEIMTSAPLLAQIDVIAKRMASAKATVPKHLQGSEGDCWAVVMQAVQWRMNPFAVCQKTHLVNGTLGYEAQLVNAVVQNSGAISSVFHYQFEGKGNDLQCRVGATLRGDNDITWGEWLKISDVVTKNSPLWKTNPKQQLGYLQVKNWARLYCPGAILGVYTPDELASIPQEREVGPAAVPGESRVASLKNKLQAQAAPVDVVEAPEPEVEGEPEGDIVPLTFAMCAEAINTAENHHQIKNALDLVQDFLSADDNAQYRDELADLYQIRVKALSGGDNDE